MLQKALKSNFWPISCWFLLERPVPSQFFWKNTAFIIKWISWADRSSTFKMAFLAVLLWILEYIYQILKSSNVFYLFFLKINPFINVYYIKFIKKNPYSQILRFLKNSTWNFKFSYIFRWSPLCMNEEKWKQSQEIKLP